MNEDIPEVRLNFYDFLLLLARWWKLFVATFLVAAIISSIIALTLPVVYRATTVILPPSGGSGGLPSFLSKDIVGAAMSFGLEVPTLEIYQTILSSKTLRLRLMERFNLREVYKISPDAPLEDAFKEINSHIKVSTRVDQSIEIHYEDRNPKLAAQLAEACVEELDNLYRDITSETARKNRIYISKRIAEITDTLAVLQDRVISFQRQHHTISISEQTMAMINAIADLKAQQLALQIKLEVLRNSFSENHPSVKQLRATIDELRTRGDALQAQGEGGIFIGLVDIPLLARRYADLMRLVRVQSSLLEYIYPQYENARIQEERETANVQILDHATVPFYKSRPPRKLIVMVASVSAIILTLVVVVLLEYWRGLPQKNARDWQKIREVKKLLAGRNRNE
ncbi:MAG: hypothetical protein FJY65_06125 [Calditrichaeota bacterium]|nr:hypothetical protein [Calditrichota bacterium]